MHYPDPCLRNSEAHRESPFRPDSATSFNDEGPARTSRPEPVLPTVDKLRPASVVQHHECSPLQLAASHTSVVVAGGTLLSRYVVSA